MDKEQERQMYRAVERFTAMVTIPILCDVNEETVDQKGTGTLFEHEGRLFLVTASHIFDEMDPKDLVIPSTQTTELHGIGPYDLVRADKPELDIAVVEIKSEQTAARARSGWHILNVTNTAVASPQGVFALAGYPSERAKRTGGLLGGSLLTFYTERVDAPEDTSDPAVDDLDLFFRYDREVLTTAGEEMKAPHLRGCSGASVWEYSEPQGMLFWTPEQCLKIVGLQASFKPGRWFRAKSWAYVHEMIRRICAK